MTSIGWRGLLAICIFFGLTAGTAAGALLMPANPDRLLHIAYFALATSAITGLCALIATLAGRRHIESADISAALADAPGGFLIANRQGVVETANQTICEIVAHPELKDPDDLCGHTVASLLGGAAWEAMTSQREVLQQGQGTDVELELQRPQKPRCKLLCHVRLNRGPGWRQRYLIHVTNLTAAHEAERAEASAGRLLRRIIGQSSDFMLLTDSKLAITYANPYACHKLALSESELLGSPVYRMLEQNSRKRFMKALEHFGQRHRNTVNVDQLYLQGRTDTAATAHIIRLTGTRPAGYAVIFDIDGRAHDWQGVDASMARFSQIFHSSPDAILVLRAEDTTILDFNDGFNRLLGYQREDAIGETEASLGFWANATERAAVVERLREDHEVSHYETMLKTAAGKLVHVEISLRYIDIDNTLCVLCIGRDITKRISAEAALVESEQKFEKVFSQSPDGIVILRHTDGVITDLNHAMLSRSGYERDEIIGQSIYDFPEFLDTKELKEATNDIASDGKLANQAVTFHTKSGEAVPSLVSATVLELSGEAFVMVIAKDISKQRTTEERLRRSEERFRGIFENAPIGILLVDMQGRIFQANHTAANLLAYDEQHMNGIHVSRLVPASDRAKLKESLSGLTLRDDRAHRSERRMICQNGLEIWTNFHVVLQRSGSGEPLYYIVQVADITDIKQGQQRMERMAFYDTLTNLANRRLFHERLSHAIEHCVRNNCISALLYLDLDNFKRVNDTLGHQMGDDLLREVASRLQLCVRGEDTVGRTGGDEFTILLADIGSPTDAGVVAQKILNHLREPITISGQPLVVTTSIGITVLPGDGLDPNELLRNADLAMYKAKERGRNNYQFYSEDLNTNAVQRLRTEYEIREALDKKQFELYFQPKVSLVDHQIVGFESLIRWNHPDRGLLTPDEFIGVAEDTGIIIDIGAWVIEEACGAARSLSEQQGRPIQIAVNISPRQFRDPNLVATVRRSLREAELAPDAIELEITETMLMQDVEAAQATVERLSELGVRLAIDDFGTGYSSLNYLKRFPINTVKVDRSFIMDIPDNQDDVAITRAVIAMAHQLKMEVVAEGVETTEQLTFLAQQSCEYAQGWLFSKALPVAEASKLLGTNLGVAHNG